MKSTLIKAAIFCHPTLLSSVHQSTMSKMIPLRSDNRSYEARNLLSTFSMTETLTSFGIIGILVLTLFGGVKVVKLIIEYLKKF